MYFPYLEISNVRHSLKLLQVAVQLEYLKLVEECVNYLIAVQWCEDNERRIQKFALSLHYLKDCAADLSTRLGLSLPA